MVKNKKSVLYIYLFLAVQLTAQNIQTVFINMPIAVNATLSKQNRLEMLEYYKHGMKDSVDNKFKGKSVLIKLDSINQHIIAQTTNNSLLEIKILKASNGSPMIGVIKTIKGTAPLSNINFYDTAWHKLPLNFEMPKSIMWLKSDTADNTVIDKKWLNAMLQKSYVSLSFESAMPYIQATNNTPALLDEYTSKQIIPILNPYPITYILEGEKWMVK